MFDLIDKVALVAGGTGY